MKNGVVLEAPPFLDTKNLVGVKYCIPTVILPPATAHGIRSPFVVRFCRADVQSFAIRSPDLSSREVVNPAFETITLKHLWTAVKICFEDTCGMSIWLYSIAAVGCMVLDVFTGRCCTSMS